MDKLNIGQDFSDDPSGRYRADGDSSGEAFREDLLRPALQKLDAGKRLVIVLDDNVEGYGSSFLVEGFAGMVKYGYMKADELLSRVSFEYKDSEFKFYEDKIIKYVTEAQFNSVKYVPKE